MTHNNNNKFTLQVVMVPDDNGRLFYLETGSGPLPAPDADPLENLLIEHPSMSVYQIRCRMQGAEEEEVELASDDDDEEETSR